MTVTNQSADAAHGSSSPAASSAGAGTAVRISVPDPAGQQRREVVDPPAAPWWHRADWMRFLTTELHYRGQRRYALVMSSRVSLAATDPVHRQVLINPTALPCPTGTDALSRIRHLGAMVHTGAIGTADHHHTPAGHTSAWTRPEAEAADAAAVFQQGVAVALVDHEACHCRWTDIEKPSAICLGWLFNAVEDERIERRLAAMSAEIAARFDFLGDLALDDEKPTHDLLAGCLLHRWQHDRPPELHKFTPASDDDRILWEQEIVPLVEAAWAAETASEALAVARRILQRLNLPEDAPLTADLPIPLCGCQGSEAGPGGVADGAGDAPAARSRSDGSANAAPLPSEPPTAPPGARLPGSREESGGEDVDGSGGSAPPDGPDGPDGSQAAGNRGGSGAMGGGGTTDERTDQAVQATPAETATLRASVAPLAGYLAQLLRPQRPHGRYRPDASRGELNIDRYVEGSDRVFDRRVPPLVDRTRAIVALCDMSGSMDDTDAGGTGPIAGARRLLMCLSDACDQAGVSLGIGGFRDGPHLIGVRPLTAAAADDDRARIAGITARGGTQLAPALAEAATLLQRSLAQQRLLLLLIDGALMPSDAGAVRHLLADLHTRRIHVLPLFVGDDAETIARIEALLAGKGGVLAHPDLGALLERLISWLRARGW